MCTVISSRTKAKIAREDIQVYKICREVPGGVSSSVMGYFYKKDELNQSDITFTSEREYFDETEGYYLESISYPRFIEKGFHSLPNRNYEDRCYGEKICSFIIPKGACYYRSGIGRMVSNQIIFKKVIK